MISLVYKFKKDFRKENKSIEFLKEVLKLNIEIFRKKINNNMTNNKLFK